MTYREALEYGDKKLSESGIAEHKKDGELLLLFITGKDRTFVLTHGDESELSPGEEEGYKELILKRGKHIPLQLLTGCTDFMGLDFKVSDKVLIPRIDTEFLVEEALKYINNGASILDMCCGSGCILLSLMKYRNDIDGTGADISHYALSLSRENAERLGINSAVFIESDLFSAVEGSFDHIVCNPPYIRSADIGGLMEEVRCHEPVNALDGGEDGLEFYRRVAADAWEHLNGGGHIFFEIGYDQGEDVSCILKDAGYKNIKVIKDYSGNERVVICSKS